MAYEQRDGSGALFKNKEKKQETHADYQGNIVINGQDFWLNAWLKKDRNGNTYMSVSAKPKQQPAIAPHPASAKAQQQRQTPQPSSGFDDLDSIPF